MAKNHDDLLEPWDGANCHSLRNESGKKLEGELPEMHITVEVLWRDGSSTLATRIPAFEEGCGWLWEAGVGWIVAGHPNLVAWRDLSDA